ncbi:MAG: diguanylate cyclase [Desulfuromonadaceae bacterium]|nr:diguanylate cyclase [Desulfuromonadaceae bacterium]
MLDNAQIIETIDLGLIVLDRGMVVRGWNRWMEIHSGVSAQEIIGTVITDRYPNLGEPKYRRMLKSVLTFGSYAYFSQKLHQYLIPLENPHSTVEQMPYMQQSCSAAPLRDQQGMITGLFISVHDVTEYTIYENKLLEMTKIDSLTRLYNRSYLDKRLTEELERTHRFGNVFSVIMIDVDYFKRINDTRGHLCGDYTLRQLALILLQVVRSVDFVGRYGGEEFCCVLPETSAANACILAECLRKKIADEQFVYGQERFSITISLGVAEYGDGADTLERLVGLADAALYQAKREGRNRVVCAESSALPLFADDQESSVW